ncbi:MAG: hypothetical protein RLZZ522_457 [Verrucomicrobiota bacterium]|jgi:hypothetical protein
MVSRIEPDRYADTGFAVKDTPPEINAMIFAAMMRKTPEERLLMGFDMMATAREMVWSGIGHHGSEEARRSLFCQRFHGADSPWKTTPPATGSPAVGTRDTKPVPALP